jgi:hypothetical protein
MGNATLILSDGYNVSGVGPDAQGNPNSVTLTEASTGDTVTITVGLNKDLLDKLLDDLRNAFG